MISANDKKFRLDNWLGNPQASSKPHHSFETQESAQEIEGLNQNTGVPFYPPKFFTPGWQGEGLFSKEAISIKKALLLLWQDSKTQFFQFERLNKSLRIKIFEEFASFFESKRTTLHPLKDHREFWEHVQSSESDYNKLISEFIEVYTFRVVVTYVFKVRFILKLCDSIGSEVLDNYLRNPSGFLAKIFRKGSSSELNCESLQSNQYSWFRPSHLLRGDIHKMCFNLRHLSITEMMKVCTYQEKYASQNFSDSKVRYSHSMSHKSFGLFLNNLLVNLPKWFIGAGNYYSLPMPQKELSVLNTKFVGDYLTSLSQSHWLAQENNLKLNWDSVICPDFIGDRFDNGNFVKNCHEINFLNFLLDLAERVNIDPISFLTSVIKKKYQNSQDQLNGQMNMFSLGEIDSKLVYDRMVINLSEFPKKNPHHYLITSINKELEHLHRNGVIFVLSNQKLFVPSQSNKVDQLLERVKLTSIIDLDELDGKGEIPSYVYVFKKRVSNRTSFLDQSTGKLPIKEPCHTFRLNGELTQFQHFTQYSDHLVHFFENKNTLTSLYQKEITEKLNLEYFQDAILEGKLLHSSSKDPEKITHPSFFKNLTKSSVTLDFFFQIENLQNYLKEKHQSQSQSLGMPVTRNKVFPFILIVNYTDPSKIKLDIIGHESLLAKLDSCGFAYYSYYGLSPKFQDLNINIFREFFNTDLGTQIVQLSLNGKNTKLKGKLSSMLIPKFFSHSERLDSSKEKEISFLSQTSEELLKLHPEEIPSNFSRLTPSLFNYSKSNPWHILSILCYFKNQCNEAKSKLTNGNNSTYNNPLIIKKLLTLETYPIYPHNQEVFVEFEVREKSEFKLPLEKVILESKDGQDCISLQSNGNTVLRLFSEPTLLKFVEFIGQSAIGAPILSILTGVKIPRVEDLKIALSSHQQLSESLEKTEREVTNSISMLITSQINS